MEQNDYFKIFDTKIEDIKSFEEPESTDYSKIFFEPTPKDAKTPFIAVIKWLPNIYDPIDAFPKRFYYKLPDADRAGRHYQFVSPTTVGEVCPVVDTWFANKDSEDPIKKKAAGSLTRKRSRAGVVQILKCPSEPSLEGQIRIFRFQYDGDLDKLIQSRMNPTDEEKQIGKVAENIIDPFESSLMILKVSKGDYGRDFSGSEWAQDRKSGMKIGEKFITKSDATNPEIQKQIIEMLKDENVSLKEHFMYAPPSEEMMKRVKKSLDLLFSGSYDFSKQTEDDENHTENAEQKTEQKTEKKTEKKTENKAAGTTTANDILADMGFKKE